MSDTPETEKAEALLDALRADGSVTERARVTGMEQLDGGWSRHSYLAQVEDEGAESELIVRVRPQGSVLDTDIGVEFRTLELLNGQAVASPAVSGYQPSGDNPFTGPFFVMEKLSGRAVNVWRERDRQELLADWEGGRAIATGLVENLAALHNAGGDLAGSMPIQRSFAENVSHWRGIYEDVRLVRDPVVDEAFAWVESRPPSEIASTLVHGDYRIGNCLIGEPGAEPGVTGILDWELAFVGDPRFDLGYLAMEYYAGKLNGPGSDLLNAVADREWFFAEYSRLTGIEVDGHTIDTYAALGTLMVFTIMTTGLRIYAEGQSDDIRMAWMRYVLPSFRQDLVNLMGW